MKYEKAKTLIDNQVDLARNMAKRELGGSDYDPIDDYALYLLIKTIAPTNKNLRKELCEEYKIWFEKFEEEEKMMIALEMEQREGLKKWK